MPISIRYAGTSSFRLTVPDEGIILDPRTALIGRSGAGKSTLVKALAGPWHQLEADGGDRTWTSALRTKLSISGDVLAVHQDPWDCLLPWSTVESHHKLIRKLQGAEKAEDFLFHLAAMGLDYDAYRRHYPANLSGGQQRRLALALALSFRPGLLVIDEALGSLDVKTVDQVMRHVMNLTETKGLQVLLVSHDLYTISVFSNAAMTIRANEVVMLRKQNLSDAEWLESLKGEFL